MVMLQNRIIYFATSPYFYLFK